MLDSRASKFFVFAFVGLFGLCAVHPVHAATTWLFDYTDSVQTFDVKRSGVYDITLHGAQGGASFFASGGLGAEIGGEVALNAGEILTILVGGKGGGGGFNASIFNESGAGGGGGGATYVVLDPGDLLLIAGGGGGAGRYDGGQGLPLFSINGGTNGLGRGGGENPNGEAGGGGGYNGYGYPLPYGATGGGGEGFDGGIAAGGQAIYYPFLGPSGGNGGDGGAGGGAGGIVAPRVWRQRPVRRRRRRLQRR